MTAKTAERASWIAHIDALETPGLASRTPFDTREEAERIVEHATNCGLTARVEKVVERVDK